MVILVVDTVPAKKASFHLAVLVTPKSMVLSPDGAKVLSEVIVVPPPVSVNDELPSADVVDHIGILY